MTARPVPQIRAEIRAVIVQLAALRREHRTVLAQRRAKAIQLLAKGHTSKQIARATGLTWAGVKDLFWREGLKRQRPPLRTLPAEQQRIYYRLRAQRIPALEARARASELANINEHEFINGHEPNKEK